VKYFVTGAAGFIGGHLCTALLDAGHEVTGLDDLSTGRAANLAAASAYPQFTFTQGTVLDPALLTRLAAGAGVIYHLAAAVGSFVIRDHTLDAMRTNIHGTEHVTTAALDTGAILVAASTSEIYGKNTKIGLREDDDRILGSPLKSRWSYAEAKAIDESLIEATTREKGLKAVIVRLFNTVGPRQTGRYGMVIPRFTHQALTGQPLTIYGTGAQIRCFCHIHDIIPALITLPATPAAWGLAVNLGSTEQVTIAALAEKIITAARSSSVITHTSYLDAYGPGYEDMQRRVPDCTLATTLTGFTPTRTLDTIINDVIADQKTQQPTTAVTAS
jgi:UDP-glucose 4-epimerase